MTEIQASVPAPTETVVYLVVDGVRYAMQLPDAATDYIQKKIATEKQPYEYEMLADIRSRVAPGDLVVDVGANVGNHTLFLAAAAGCAVEAFEPNPGLCAAILASVALNGLSDRVRVHTVGVGRASAHAHFEKSLPENLGAQRLSLGEGEVEVIALDTRAFDRPVKVLKIDIEGMEIDALEGARGTIARDRPLLYIECISERAYKEVARWLDSQSYTPWSVFNATPTHLFVPAEAVTIEQRVGRLQVLAGLDDHRNMQLLREIRQKLTQALNREALAHASLEALERVHRDLQTRHLTVSEARIHAEVRASSQEADRARLDAAVVDERARRSNLEAAVADAHSRQARIEAALAEQQAQRTKVEATLADVRIERNCLRAAFDETSKRLRGCQVRLDATVKQREIDRLELGRLAESSAELGKLRNDHELLKQQHSRATEASAELKAKLERMLTVARLQRDAFEHRAKAMTERADKLERTTSFRVGRAMVTGGTSLGGMLKLPAALWGIYRDAIERRRARSLAALEATPTRPVHSPKVPASKPTGGTAGTAGASPVSGSSAPLVAKVANPPLTATSTALASYPPAAARPMPLDLQQLKVACVMDEFTFHSFAPECRLLPLKPQEWEAQLEEFQPDLVFIESAWRGVDDLWTLKVSNASPEIMGVIDWSRVHGVPTAFWNKEDPVHFGGFQHIAKVVDHVFTTDIDCIARYKREVGHERVYLLPFAAQPTIHNPIERFDRKHAFCFAGSYYLKYPERQRDFRSLIDVVSQLGPVEIYDRNHHKPHPHYEFPSEYGQYIVGSLPFDQIDKAYKGYLFGINMNTIKQSQTMFARRVFELLACNTVVVSNFSHGVRLLFQDLVVCSDEPIELRRRLTWICADETRLRKHRLAGVRKILSEHTYAHRLAYVVSTMTRRPASLPAPTVCVLAFASEPVDIARIIAMFRSQAHMAKRLCLVGAPSVEVSQQDVVRVEANDAEGQRAALAGAQWIAPWAAADHYGANYLLDLCLATRYSSAVVIGKATSYEMQEESIVLCNDGRQYREHTPLAARCSMIRAAAFAACDLPDAVALERFVFATGERLSIDEFNYCRNGATRSDVSASVDDAPHLRTGLSYTGDVLPRAEAIRPAEQAPAEVGNPASLPGRSAEELSTLIPKRLPAGLVRTVEGGRLKLQSRLPADKHVYVYLDRVFARTEVNLEFNSRFELMVDNGELDLRTVFEFLDADKQKVGHSITRAGVAQSMAIPSNCRFVRFGLRVQGTGTIRIERLVLGSLKERPNTLLPTARHLLLTKQYPAYDDLYKYGFVHSRIRAYREEGVDVDIFRINATEPCLFREFENIDVIQGDRDLLDLALRTGKYTNLLIHLLDQPMWEAIRGHLAHMKIVIWVHGAEIQDWSRRAFDGERFPDEEVERRVKLGEQRLKLWREVLKDSHPNLHFVFVSHYLARQAFSDLDVELPSSRYSIIHNVIDGDLFTYHAKPAPQRYRILAIRPFSSRIYANDLTAEAIRILSGRPIFQSLEFRIIGDGELFDEVTAPLKAYRNVFVERRFLSQQEIASLYREYGVFLVPSRMDTQGVSRGEAMAAGLVPVTSRVAAIPEFVDEECAMLTDAEDALGLADAIETLASDPERFARMSLAAAARVRAQCGPEQTVGRELVVLRSQLEFDVQAPASVQAKASVTA